MFKLMKYESLRKIKLLLISLVIIGLFEIGILFTIYKGGYSLGLTAFLIWFLGVGGLIFALVDSITMYSHDLHRKPGYMLFLTPNNSYKIIGSKLLISLIEVAVGAVIYVSLNMLNYSIIYRLYFNDPDSPARKILDFITNIEHFPSPSEALMILLSLIVTWFTLILTIYLSITISKTLLSNVKFGGLFSFIFFIILYVIIIFIHSKLVGSINGDSIMVNNIINISYSTFVSILLYIGSSTLLSKGVDL
ncbi:MAG: hypothetical protein N4A50_06100 [Vallitalea sp.]|nr:hypothetical protein [Vallitalea sp.]